MNGQHNDISASYAKVDRVGEPWEHSATRFTVDTRKYQWTRRDAFDEGVRRLTELCTKTGSPRLIPSTHFKHIVFSLRPEDDLPGHDSAQKLRAHFGPRNGRVRILLMFSPTSIEFSPLRISQLQLSVPLRIGEAVP